MKRYQVLSVFSSVLLTSCASNVASTSNVFLPSLSEPLTGFYARNYYLNSDPDNNKDQVILLIYSDSCSHCHVAEPHFAKILSEAEYSEFNIVTATSADLIDNNYSIGKNFDQMCEFYTSQAENFIEFPNLKEIGTYPTPSMVYLRNSQTPTSMLIGAGATEAQIRLRLELLLGK